MENMELRNKPFEDLSDTEKIERMRGIIKGMQMNMQYLLQSIEKLNQHTHNTVNGEMVIPYKPYGNGMGLGATSGNHMAVNPGYF